MAQTAVDVVVRVKDLGALERLKKSLAGVDGATLKASQGINRFEKSLSRLQGVLGGLAVGDQLRRAFGAAADFSGTEARLKNITKQFSQLTGIQELAAVSAKNFGVSTAQASSDLADLGARLGSSGANLKDLDDIYKGFNTLLAVNAISAQEAASAQLQLNQALGSGRLAGEEYNAINEATPQLLDEVAKILKVTRGELKELAADGEISSKVLIEALRNAAEGGGDALADFFASPAGQLKLFDKAIKDFQVTVGHQLLPLFTPVIQSLSTLLGLFSQLPGPVKATAVAVATLGATFAILGGPITAVVAGVIGITLVIKKLADENEAFAAGLTNAWNGILAGLAGVGAFFQAFFSSVGEQGAAFIAYWQGLGEQIGSAWNQAVADLQTAFARWQGYFNDVVAALGGAWNQLMGLIPEAFFAAVGLLGKIFQPFIDFLNSAFGGISKAWNGLLESMSLNWGNLITEMIGMFLPFVKIFKAFGIDIGESFADGVKAGFAAIDSFQPGEMPSLNLPGVSGLSQLPTPEATGGNTKGGGGKSTASDLERELQLQKDQLQVAKDRLFAAEQLVASAQDLNEADAIKLDASQAIASIEREYEKLLADIKSNEEAAILLKAQGLEIKAEELQLEKSLAELKEGALSSIDEEIAMLQAKIAGKEEEYKIQKKIQDLIAAGGGTVSPEEAASKVSQLTGLQEQAKQADELKSQYESLASGIAGSFTSAFKSIIDGSKDAGEAFSDMLKGMADQFLNMAMKILQDALTQQLIKLFGSLFSAGASPGGGLFGAGASPGGAGGVAGIGGGMANPYSFAGGGYTGSGSRSGGIDGQGGFPAILHPQETVVDHYDDARSAMTSSASTAAAFAESSEAMAAASNNYAYNSASNSYSNSSSSSSVNGGAGELTSYSNTIQLETNVINKVEYATVEEVNKKMQQSAKQAEAQVYRNMRNKSAVRSRVGV